MLMTRKSCFRLIRLFAGVAIFEIVGLAIAGGEGVAPAPPGQGVQTAPNIFYCPSIAELKKDPDSRTWYAGSGWKSYDLSFVDKITRFSGAQWRGTNVGQIFCIYRGESETAFPILLAYKILALAPQGGEWSGNLDGYENCETPIQANCPFSIRVQTAPADIYEQAEQLKHPPSPSLGPGF